MMIDLSVVPDIAGALERVAGGERGGVAAGPEAATGSGFSGLLAALLPAPCGVMPARQDVTPRGSGAPGADAAGSGDLEATAGADGTGDGVPAASAAVPQVSGRAAAVRPFDPMAAEAVRGGVLRAFIIAGEAAGCEALLDAPAGAPAPRAAGLGVLPEAGGTLPGRWTGVEVPVEIAGGWPMMPPLAAAGRPGAATGAALPEDMPLRAQAEPSRGAEAGLLRGAGADVPPEVQGRVPAAQQAGEPSRGEAGAHTERAVGGGSGPEGAVVKALPPGLKAFVFTGGGQPGAGGQSGAGDGNPAPAGDARPAAFLNAVSGRKAQVPGPRPAAEQAFLFSVPQGAQQAGAETAAGRVGAASVVSTVHDEIMQHRALGKSRLSFEIRTAAGEPVRVHLVMRNNTVSGRIGVIESETRDLLALHMPELTRRLLSEDLLPQRLEVYIMDDERQGGRRGGDRRSRRQPHAPGQAPEESAPAYVSSGTRAFERWA